MDFRALFEEHVSYVWSSLRRLGVRDEDRDDLTQEVFMTAHDLLADFDATRPFRPWVFAISYRIVLRYRRRLGRARTVSGESEEVLDPVPSAQAQLEAAEGRALVTRALAGIELSRRAVFIMKEIDGQDVPEIAAALGIPLNTAYSRLRLAREDFRQVVTRLQAKGGKAHV